MILEVSALTGAEKWLSSFCQSQKDFKSRSWFSLSGRRPLGISLDPLVLGTEIPMTLENAERVSNIQDRLCSILVLILRLFLFLNVPLLCPHGCLVPFT